MKIFRKQFWSVCLGNLFEHYDTALFGFLSPFLAPIFFPQHEPLMALVLTYAIIPLGMLMRPLGALFFGYLGDVKGRGMALFVSLLGMGILSFCIASIPTFEKIGALAPILFCIARLMQNFLASGEIMGGAIFLLEETEEKRHDLMSSLYSASTLGGILLASLGVSFLCVVSSPELGWRWLYVIGGLTAFFGCLLREGQRDLPPVKNRCTDIYPTQLKNWRLGCAKASKINSRERVNINSIWTLSRELILESFGASRNVNSSAVLGIAQTLWSYRKEIALIAVSSGFSYASYSIALVLTSGLVPLVSAITKEEVMQLNTALLVFDLALLPLFGWISSKISREKLMLGASLCTLISGIPLFLMLEQASWMEILGVRSCFVILGVAFCAPLHAWLQKLVPETYRYLVISFGYALGSQLLGSPTAVISLWLFKQTGMISSVSWYWMVLAFLTTLGIFRSLRTFSQDNRCKASH